MEEQWWQDDEHQKLDAKTYFLGSTAVYGEEEAMTEKERQIRWVHSIFEAAASDCQLGECGLPMNLLLLLLGVCLTQIGQQRMIDNREEKAPPDEEVPYPKEARVLRSVLNEAKIKLGRSEFMDGNCARQAELFLQALLEGCSSLIRKCPPRRVLDETPDTCQENDEKQQVRALLCVMDDAIGDQNKLQCGDIKMLLNLLRNLCGDFLVGNLGEEVNNECRREVRKRLWFQAPLLLQSECFTADPMPDAF